MKSTLLTAFLLMSAIPAIQSADLSGNRQFAIDLYQQFAAENPQANLFFSPYSISTALAMTYTGARGQTGSFLSS